MNAIDLFSGAGGLTRATCDSGFNIVLSNEVNPVFAKTHDYNFPSIPMVIDDINNLTTEVINEYVKGQEIDLVEGGPPCQGFSIFGKRRFVNTQGYDPKQDPRNFLVYQYIRIVKETKPKFFFMENVKGFTNLDNGLFIEKVKKEFEKLGYKNIWCAVVCAADYGVPQERYRMFMIGNRLGIDFIPPEPTHFSVASGRKPIYKTVGDAIMDLVGKENEIPNHVPLQHKPIVAARYSYIKEGCKLNLDDLPPEQIGRAHV